eukprot:511074_1
MSVSSSPIIISSASAECTKSIASLLSGTSVSPSPSVLPPTMTSSSFELSIVHNIRLILHGGFITISHIIGCNKILSAIYSHPRVATTCSTSLIIFFFLLLKHTTTTTHKPNTTNDIATKTIT